MGIEVTPKWLDSWTDAGIAALLARCRARPGAYIKVAPRGLWVKHPPATPPPRGRMSSPLEAAANDEAQ